MAGRGGKRTLTPPEIETNDHTQPNGAEQPRLQLLPSCRKAAREFAARNEPLSGPFAVNALVFRKLIFRQPTRMGFGIREIMIWHHTATRAGRLEVCNGWKAAISP